MFSFNLAIVAFTFVTKSSLISSGVFSMSIDGEIPRTDFYGDLFTGVTFLRD